MSDWEESWDVPELPDVPEPPRRPRVTLLLLAMIAIGYVLSGQLASAFALDTVRVMTDWQWWRALTYAFIFDTNEPAAAFNLIYFLAVSVLFFHFCRDLEFRIGGARVLAAFLFAPVVGALAVIGLQHWTGTPLVMTAETFPGVAAVIFMAGLSEPGRRVRTFFFLPTRQVLAAVFTLTLIVLALTAIYQTFIVCVPLAVAMGTGLAALKVRPLVASLSKDMSRRMERARADRDVEMRREVDAILAKIHSSGMSSLNRTERRILKKASRRYADTRKE